MCRRELAQATASRLELAAPVGGGLFLAASNNWIGWEEAIRNRFASDVLEYEAIASAAPQLTHEELLTNHAPRFGVHYLTGLLSETGLPLHVVYRILAIACLFGVVLLVDRILRGLPLRRSSYALLMGSLLAMPYVFRYLAVAPGMLQDTAFVLATAALMLGLLQGRTWLVTASLCLAVATRVEGALPLLPVVGVWLWVGPGFPHSVGGVRMRRLAVAIGLPLLVYVAVRWTATLFPNRGSVDPSPVVEDIANLPAGIDRLALHVGRTALGIAMPGALLLALGITAHRRQALCAMPFELWGSLALAAALVLQPLLLSVNFTVGGEPRLSALAAVPLVTACAIATAALRPRGGGKAWPSFARAEAVLIIVLLAASSLSHRFAEIGPASPAQFATLVLVCSVCLATLLARAFERRAPT